MRFRSVLLLLLLIVMLNTWCIGAERIRVRKPKDTYKRQSVESTSQIEVKAQLTSCNPEKACTPDESTKDSELFLEFERDEPPALSKITNCRRKLIITMKFTNFGKTQIDEKLVVLDSVYNCFTQEKDRLLHPMVFKVKQDQVMQMYKMNFLHVVNSKAREEVFNDESSHYTGCDDFSEKPTCGFSYYKGEQIPYSQGFCCSCNATKNALRQPKIAQGIVNEKSSGDHYSGPNGIYRALQGSIFGKQNTLQDESVDLEESPSQKLHGVQKTKKHIKSRIDDAIPKEEEETDEDVEDVKQLSGKSRNRENREPNSKMDRSKRNGKARKKNGVPKEITSSSERKRDNQQHSGRSFFEYLKSKIQIGRNKEGLRSDPIEIDKLSPLVAPREDDLLNPFENDERKCLVLDDSRLGFLPDADSKLSDSQSQDRASEIQANELRENNSISDEKVEEERNELELETNTQRALHQDREMYRSFGENSKLPEMDSAFIQYDEFLFRDLQSAVQEVLRQRNTKRRNNDDEEILGDDNNHDRNFSATTPLTTREMSTEDKQFEEELSKVIDEVLLQHIKSDPVFTEQTRRRHEKYGNKTAQRMARDIMSALRDNHQTLTQDSLDARFFHLRPETLNFEFSKPGEEGSVDANEKSFKRDVVNNYGDKRSQAIVVSLENPFNLLQPYHRAEKLESHKCPCSCPHCPLCPKAHHFEFHSTVAGVAKEIATGRKFHFPPMKSLHEKFALTCHKGCAPRASKASRRKGTVCRTTACRKTATFETTKSSQSETNQLVSESLQPLSKCWCVCTPRGAIQSKIVQANFKTSKKELESKGMEIHETTPKYNTNRTTEETMLTKRMPIETEYKQKWITHRITASTHYASKATTKFLPTVMSDHQISALTIRGSPVFIKLLPVTSRYQTIDHKSSTSSHVTKCPVITQCCVTVKQSNATTPATTCHSTTTEQPTTTTKCPTTTTKCHTTTKYPMTTSKCPTTTTKCPTSTTKHPTTPTNCLTTTTKCSRTSVDQTSTTSTQISSFLHTIAWGIQPKIELLLPSKPSMQHRKPMISFDPRIITLIEPRSIVQATPKPLTCTRICVAPAGLKNKSSIYTKKPTMYAQYLENSDQTLMKRNSTESTYAVRKTLGRRITNLISGSGRQRITTKKYTHSYTWPKYSTTASADKAYKYTSTAVLSSRTPKFFVSPIFQNFRPTMTEYKTPLNSRHYKINHNSSRKQNTPEIDHKTQFMTITLPARRLKEHNPKPFPTNMLAIIARIPNPTTPSTTTRHVPGATKLAVIYITERSQSKGKTLSGSRRKEAFGLKKEEVSKGLITLGSKNATSYGATSRNEKSASRPMPHSRTTPPLIRANVQIVAMKVPFETTKFSNWRTAESGRKAEEFLHEFKATCALNRLHHDNREKAPYYHSVSVSSTPWHCSGHEWLVSKGTQRRVEAQNVKFFNETRPIAKSFVRMRRNQGQRNFRNNDQGRRTTQPVTYVSRNSRDVSEAVYSAENQLNGLFPLPFREAIFRGERIGCHKCPCPCGRCPICPKVERFPFKVTKGKMHDMRETGRTKVHSPHGYTQVWKPYSATRSPIRVSYLKVFELSKGSSPGNTERPQQTMKTFLVTNIVDEDPTRKVSGNRSVLMAKSTLRRWKTTPYHGIATDKHERKMGKGNEGLPPLKKNGEDLRKNDSGLMLGKVQVKKEEIVEENYVFSPWTTTDMVPTITCLKTQSLRTTNVFAMETEYEGKMKLIMSPFRGRLHPTVDHHDYALPSTESLYAKDMSSKPKKHPVSNTIRDILRHEKKNRLKAMHRDISTNGLESTCGGEHDSTETDQNAAMSTLSTLDANKETAIQILIPNSRVPQNGKPLYESFIITRVLEDMDSMSAKKVSKDVTTSGTVLSSVALSTDRPESVSQLPQPPTTQQILTSNNMTYSSENNFETNISTNFPQNGTNLQESETKSENLKEITCSKENYKSNLYFLPLQISTTSVNMLKNMDSLHTGDELQETNPKENSKQDLLFLPQQMSTNPASVMREEIETLELTPVGLRPNIPKPKIIRNEEEEKMFEKAIYTKQPISAFVNHENPREEQLEGRKDNTHSPINFKSYYLEKSPEENVEVLGDKESITKDGKLPTLLPDSGEFASEDYGSAGNSKGKKLTIRNNSMYLSAPLEDGYVSFFLIPPTLPTDTFSPPTKHYDSSLTSNTTIHESHSPSTKAREIHLRLKDLEHINTAEPGKFWGISNETVEFLMNNNSNSNDSLWSYAYTLSPSFAFQLKKKISEAVQSSRTDKTPIDVEDSDSIKTFVSEVPMETTLVQIMKVKKPVEHLILSPIAHVAKKRPKVMHPGLKTTIPRWFYDGQKPNMNSISLRDSFISEMSTDGFVKSIPTGQFSMITPSRTGTETRKIPVFPDINARDRLVSGGEDAQMDKTPQRDSDVRVVGANLKPKSEARLLWMQNEENISTTTQSTLKTSVKQTLSTSENKPFSSQIMKDNEIDLSVNGGGWRKAGDSSENNLPKIPSLAVEQVKNSRNREANKEENGNIGIPIKVVILPESGKSPTLGIDKSRQRYFGGASDKSDTEHDDAPQLLHANNDVTLPKNQSRKDEKMNHIAVPQVVLLPETTRAVERNILSNEKGSLPEEAWKPILLDPMASSKDFLSVSPDNANSLLPKGSSILPPNQDYEKIGLALKVLQPVLLPDTFTEAPEIEQHEAEDSGDGEWNGNRGKIVYALGVTEPMALDGVTRQHGVAMEPSPPVEFEAQPLRQPSSQVASVARPQAQPPPPPPPPLPPAAWTRRKRSVVSHGAARSHKYARHFVAKHPPPLAPASTPTAASAVDSPPQGSRTATALRRRRRALKSNRSHRRHRLRRRGLLAAKHEMSVDDHGRQLRGGQNCFNCSMPAPNINPMRYKESAHCLRFSQLWYGVYSLCEPQVGNSLNVQLFHHQVLPHGNCGCWAEVTRGKRIMLDPGHREISSGDPAYYSFNYIVPKSLPDGLVFESDVMRLLVPQTSDEGDMHDLEEVRGGPSKYLVVPSDEITPDGSECDRVGVGFMAFATQPERCDRPRGTCLRRQPSDLWQQDAEAERRGRTGKYFLHNFADLPPQPLRPQPASNAMHLVLNFNSLYSNLVDIEVRADNNLAIPKGLRAGSIFLQSVVTDCSSSDHTTVQATVTNLALVAGPVRVRVRGCALAPTGPKGTMHQEHWAHEVGHAVAKGRSSPSWNETSGALNLAPQHSRSVHMRLASPPPDAYVQCTVEVVTAQSLVVASRSAAFRRGSRCACIWYCACVCLGAVVGSMACTPLRSRVYREAGAQGELPIDNEGENVIYLSSVWFHFVLFGASILFCLLLLGLLKGIVGCCCIPAVGRWGLGMFLDEARCLPRYREKELADRRVVYDEEGVPVHPDTFRRTVRIHNRCTELCVNTLFFLLFPVAIMMALCRRCCGGGGGATIESNKYERWSPFEGRGGGTCNPCRGPVTAPGNCGRSGCGCLRAGDTRAAGRSKGAIPIGEEEARRAQQHIAHFVLEEGVKPYEDSEEEEEDTRYVLQQLARSKESLKKLSSKRSSMGEESEPFLEDEK